MTKSSKDVFYWMLLRNYSRQLLSFINSIVISGKQLPDNFEKVTFSNFIKILVGNDKKSVEISINSTKTIDESLYYNRKEENISIYDKIIHNHSFMIEDTI